MNDILIRYNSKDQYYIPKGYHCEMLMEEYMKSDKRIFQEYIEYQKSGFWLDEIIIVNMLLAGF